MHEAWKNARERSEWASLAPGARWLLKPVTEKFAGQVAARVGAAVVGLYQPGAGLEELGFAPAELGEIATPEVVAGFSIYCAGVFIAEEVLEGWQGMTDPETGLPAEINPQSIRAALRLATPDGAPALLAPFMAWVQRPRIPIAAEARRLRDLVNAEGSNDGADAGENAPQTVPGIAALAASRTPGVWIRGGLDYRACLAIAEADGVTDQGSFVRCLAAIESARRPAGVPA